MQPFGVEITFLEAFFSQSNNDLLIFRPQFDINE
jgi:hypothetical protein